MRSHYALIVTQHKHKPDGLIFEVCHSDPGAAFGSYNNVLNPPCSSSSEKSNNLSSNIPNRNPTLELPITGTDTIFHELSMGLNGSCGVADMAPQRKLLQV